LATKKTSTSGSTGTPRSRSKKAATPETQAVVSGNNGGAAVATAREKTTPNATETTSATVSKPNFNYTPEIQNRIRQRAYELYQQRGGQHGFDIEDWLRAEGELSRR